MKKILLLAVLPAVFLFSCKKEHSTTRPPGKKYLVTLNAANTSFQQSSLALRLGGKHLAASDTLANLNTYFDVLYCFIYPSTSPPDPAIHIMQDSTMSNMGVITDSLTAGNYFFVIIAGKKGLIIDEPDRLIDGDIRYPGGHWQDFFYAKGSFTVGSQSIAQNVVLKRQVAKVEVKLLDAIPANADSLSITINPEADLLTLDDAVFQGGGFPVTTSVAIPAAAKGNTGFIMDRIVGNNSDATPFTATITCKTAANVVIATKQIDNVTCARNTKTILSGNLFTGSGGSGPTQPFTVKADTAWDSTPNQINFSLRRH